MALLNALPYGVVHAGRLCTAIRQDDRSVIARFLDGGEEGGDLLIGADGLHSTVRRQLLPEDRLRYAGYTCWRGIARVEPGTFPADTLCETWGRGTRFGFGPIGAGRIFWWATRNALESERDGTAGRKADVLACIQGWHEPVEALVNATEEETILRNDIYDRKPTIQWGEGRVTLVGDAAHPATPNLGMGACQAIEDAVVLGKFIAETLDVSSALRRYEARRQRRTATITTLSWRFGWMTQWADPLACSVRNWLIKMTPTFVERKQFEWLAAYEG